MKCCVPSCKNDSRRTSKSQGITFHVFPKDPNQRAAWLQILSLPDLTPVTSRTVVCSDHFLEEEFYDTKNNIRRIKTGVVPSIPSNAPISSRVCMICLALDAKMYHLKDYNLAQMYINVVGIQPRTDAEGRLPQQVCWECRARLTSAAAFKTKAILSDSLLNEQSLKIGDVLKIHQKHANLKSSLSRSRIHVLIANKHIGDLKSSSSTQTELADIPLFDTEHIDDLKSSSSTETELADMPLFDTEHIDDHKSSSYTKTELADIPFNDEFEIEVKQLLTDRIQIKDEEMNLMFEDITESDHNAVKTEVDLVPIPEIDIQEENSKFEDVNFSDDEATEEVCMETNDNTHATVIEDIQITEIKSLNDFNNSKHKVENVLAENIDSTVVVSNEDKFVVYNDTTTSIPSVTSERIKSIPHHFPDSKTKKQTYVKPRGRPRGKPDDENHFTIKALSQEAMIQEVLDREHSLKYKQAPFKCTICFRGFPTHDVKKRHMIKHSEESGPIKCIVCKIRVEKNRHLHIHMKNQHTEEYSCKLCPFVTRSRGVMLNHTRCHAGSTYKCSQCDLEFEKPTTLLTHKRLKHVSDCVCELCGYTFVSTNGVRRHKNLKHKHVDKNVELEGPFCELCDVKFLSKSAYDNHLRLSSKHIKNETDPNRISNDPTIKPMSAVRHRRDENTVTWHKITCEQCGVELKNMREYIWHFKKVHPGVNRTKYTNNVVPYMCEHCGKMFLNNSFLSCHMWVHTGEKRFQCDHCNKTFSMKSSLVGHMRAHMETRPSYECHVCGNRFTFPANLKRHMFLHTGLKPFKCNACDKAFCSSEQLRLHVDHVHLKKPRPKRVRRRVKKEKMSSLEY